MHSRGRGGRHGKRAGLVVYLAGSRRGGGSAHDDGSETVGRRSEAGVGAALVRGGVRRRRPAEVCRGDALGSRVGLHTDVALFKAVASGRVDVISWDQPACPSASVLLKPARFQGHRVAVVLGTAGPVARRGCVR